tara:strand:- start:1442 stop:1555 length:114 start_codon:yes stop_codon:yes gene_type:complete
MGGFFLAGPGITLRVIDGLSGTNVIDMKRRRRRRRRW